MNTQFDHEFQSSLFLFLDNYIIHQGGGSGISGALNFEYYEDTIDVPDALRAFYCPQKQLVSDGPPVADNKVYIRGGNPAAGISQSAWGAGINYAVGDEVAHSDVCYKATDVSGPATAVKEPPDAGYWDVILCGEWFPQKTEIADEVLVVDYNEGRVILDPTYYGDPELLPTMSVSGDFSQKDFNVYITNEGEEQLLVENEFVISDLDETYVQSVSGLSEKRYVIPGVFISLNTSTNEPYGFGGEDDTKETVRVVCIGDNNYSLDGILSLMRDGARKSFPLIPFTGFPYGEFFHIKETGYSYTGYREKYGYNTGKHAYIESVTTSKLFDTSNNKIPKDIRVGFADFEIANIRYPRIP